MGEDEEACSFRTVKSRLGSVSGIRGELMVEWWSEGLFADTSEVVWSALVSVYEFAWSKTCCFGMFSRF